MASPYPPTPLPDPDIAGVLTRADVEEFRRIIKEETDEDMSDTEAWTRATELVMLYRMLLGPIPEDPEVDHSPPASTSPLH